MNVIRKVRLADEIARTLMRFRVGMVPSAEADPTKLTPFF